MGRRRSELSDDFLSHFREEPSPELVSRVEIRLRQVDAEAHEARSRRRFPRLLPALATAGLVAAVALAFTLEPVRAAAREFLDLFRVKRFAAVPVDSERLNHLREAELDLRRLVGDQIEELVPPEEPETVASVEVGALTAGISAQQPTRLPKGMTLAKVQIVRPGSFRVRIDVDRLEALADLADAEEIEIPYSWNGATIEVETPPALAMLYLRESEVASDDPRVAANGVALLQARNPAIEIPEDVDLATLGRLGLRLAGMNATEAASFARSIDWRSTVLVPVPLLGGSFREVEVMGRKGLLVTYEERLPPAADGSPRRSRLRSLLLWSSEDKVFALTGRGNGIALLEMAESIR